MSHKILLMLFAVFFLKPVVLLAPGVSPNTDGYYLD
jgi:hypothetical protein